MGDKTAPSTSTAVAHPVDPLFALLSQSIAKRVLVLVGHNNKSTDL
jgi:hypothetical protein